MWLALVEGMTARLNSLWLNVMNDQFNTENTEEARRPQRKD